MSADPQYKFIETTGDVTIATPGTDQRVVIDRVIVTAQGAQPFTFKYGSTGMPPTINCPASDTVDLPDLGILYPYEQAAVVTMPGSDSPSALIYYHLEKRL